MDKYKYLGEALFLIGLAWGIIKWVGRTMREQISPSTSDLMPPGNSPESLSPLAYRTLIERGVVSPEQLAAMSPRERQFLFETTGRKLRESGAHAAGAPVAAGGGVAAPGGAVAAVAEGNLAARAASGVRAPEGLAPIAPAGQPPQALHCPACGTALTHGGIPISYEARCHACGRAVAARREGDRLTVTVEEHRA